jgi:hypothetical protein
MFSGETFNLIYKNEVANIVMPEESAEDASELNGTLNVMGVVMVFCLL